MAIQEVWLHGRGCECAKCVTDEPHIDTFIIFDSSPSPTSSWARVTVSPKMSTFMKDQYGQRYIITPIPDME